MPTDLAISPFLLAAIVFVVIGGFAIMAGGAALARKRPLRGERTIDLFTLRRRHAFLAPLLDADYGSATFLPVAGAATLELRVSTSGLLLREVKANI